MVLGLLGAAVFAGHKTQDLKEAETHNQTGTRTFTRSWTTARTSTEPRISLPTACPLFDLERLCYALYMQASPCRRTADGLLCPVGVSNSPPIPSNCERTTTWSLYLAAARC